MRSLIQTSSLVYFMPLGFCSLHLQVVVPTTPLAGYLSLFCRTLQAVPRPSCRLPVPVLPHPTSCPAPLLQATCPCSAAPYKLSRAPLAGYLSLFCRTLQAVPRPSCRLPVPVLPHPTSCPAPLLQATCPCSAAPYKLSPAPLLQATCPCSAAPYKLSRAPLAGYLPLFCRTLQAVPRAPLACYLPLFCRTLQAVPRPSCRLSAPVLPHPTSCPPRPSCRLSAPVLPHPTSCPAPLLQAICPCSAAPYKLSRACPSCRLPAPVLPHPTSCPPRPSCRLPAPVLPHPTSCPAPLLQATCPCSAAPYKLSRAPLAGYLPLFCRTLQAVPRAPLAGYLLLFCRTLQAVPRPSCRLPAPVLPHPTSCPPRPSCRLPAPVLPHPTSGAGPAAGRLSHADRHRHVRLVAPLLQPRRGPLAATDAHRVRRRR